MPLLLIDGPEAAGKTTLVESVRSAWSPTNQHVRNWGPVSSWQEYIAPLTEDVHWLRDRPEYLIIWDRCWAAEWVYNLLLPNRQDRPFSTSDASWLEDLADTPATVKVILTATVPELVLRRRLRVRQGGKPDLPVDPASELRSFEEYGKAYRWKVRPSGPFMEILGTLREMAYPAGPDASEERRWRPHTS